MCAKKSQWRKLWRKKKVRDKNEWEEHNRRETPQSGTHDQVPPLQNDSKIREWHKNSQINDLLLIAPRVRNNLTGIYMVLLSRAYPPIR